MSAVKSVVRFAVVCIVVALGLTQSVACNTTEGAGRDLEKAGESIQDAAD